jgi:2',3'-cyclic-nucleotide 2'-phosphodiesterase (5'-nucleotidase family)
MLLLLTIGCACQPPPKPARSAVTLAFTNDGRGEIRHCDCEGGAAGGIARRAGYLRRLRVEKPDGLLAVEAGDFLYAVWPETDAEKQTERARAMLIADAYARAGYDAILFGARDYALGVDALREVAAKTGAAMLGANVTDARTGRPLWSATKVIQRGLVRVGLVGLVTDKKDAVPRGLAWPADVAVENPLAAARRIVPELRKQCDVLILLANLDRDELEPLLKAVPGIDFVIKSREAKTVTTQVERLAKAPVLALYELGRYVGRLDITVVAPGKVYADLAEQRILERKIERYRSYVTAIETKAGGADKVESFFAGDRPTIERYRRYRDNVERWERELTRLKPVGNRFSYELIELDRNVPEMAELLAAVEAFERQYGTAEAARQNALRRHEAGGQ